MYFVHVILSLAHDFRYVGFTTVSSDRLAMHNRGDIKSTAPYRPFKMLLLRRTNTREEARKAEKYFKSGFGRKRIERLCKEDVQVESTENSIIDLTHLDSRDLSRQNPG